VFSKVTGKNAAVPLLTEWPVFQFLCVTLQW